MTLTFEFHIDRSR